MKSAATPGGGQVLFYGEERICWRLLRRQDNGEKILIKVNPDLRVEVLAPPLLAERSVREFVGSKARWIWRQLEEFREMEEENVPRRYISGESHLYLGRNHLIKVITDVHYPTVSVAMRNGVIVIRAAQPEPEAIRVGLDYWYRQRAKEYFKLRLDAILPQLPWKITTPPPTGSSQ